MNSDIKAKWISALRSGEYKKAMSRLYIKNVEGKETYCVLGVLTKLYCDNKEMSISDIIRRNNGQLSTGVVDWAGLENENPIIPGDGTVGNLKITQYNDGLNYSFDQLADVIEKHL